NPRDRRDTATRSGSAATTEPGRGAADARKIGLWRAAPRRAPLISARLAVTTRRRTRLLLGKRRNGRHQRNPKSAGGKSKLPARTSVQDDLARPAAPAVAVVRGQLLGRVRSQPAGATQPAGAVRQRPSGEDGILVDLARGPGHRALRRRVLREEPAVLRS